jgi:peptide/nickel transport system permease protein
MTNLTDEVPALIPQPLPSAPPQASERLRAWRSLYRAKWPVLAIALLLLIAFAAVFGPSIAPHDPNRQDIIARLKHPMEQAHRGKVTFLLGTDGLGRDVLSRLLYGARVSLAVGLISVVVGGSIGTLLGLIGGYFGGWIDDVFMRLADIQLAFPFILLAIIFMLVLGPGVLNLILVLGIGQWVTYARIARGQTILQREREYVEAARAIGQRTPGILFTGILPNILSPLVIIASFNIASVILSEAALSFLGLGVPPTVPSWGGMLAESRDQLLAGRWWLAVFPGTAIMVTVLSFNILGDWLRDLLDPRLGNQG